MVAYSEKSTLAAVPPESNLITVKLSATKSRGSLNEGWGCVHVVTHQVQCCTWLRLAAQWGWVLHGGRHPKRCCCRNRCSCPGTSLKGDC